MEAVKITTLELENVKRVRAVALSPSPNGLTVIGGKNAQGKTSVLDGICYALGGEKYRPTQLQHEGGINNASMKLTLSNGWTVSRGGKNADLVVTQPDGRKGGQNVLSNFIEDNALCLSKFLEASDDQKAVILLNTLGIGEALRQLDQEEETAYTKRHAQGISADQKLKFWRELPEHNDVPESIVSAADLMQSAQAIMQRNAERAAAREALREIEREYDNEDKELTRLTDLHAKQMAKVATLGARLSMARAVPVTELESAEEIRHQIDSMEVTNAKIRQNLDKAKAKEDSDLHQKEYAKLTEAVEAIRTRRRNLLDTARMPLGELTIGKNEKNRPILLYKGQAWDGMSTMEQMRVAVAIVRQLKPECGFVLLDHLESFDTDQLAQFAQWLESEGLQAIATRVSDGKECTVIIEDGVIAETKGELF